MLYGVTLSISFLIPDCDLLPHPTDLSSEDNWSDGGQQTRRHWRTARYHRHASAVVQPAAWLCTHSLHARPPSVGCCVPGHGNNQRRSHHLACRNGTAVLQTGERLAVWGRFPPLGKITGIDEIGEREVSWEGTGENSDGPWWQYLLGQPSMAKWAD